MSRESTEPATSLWQALDYRISNILHYDFYLAVAGAAGGIWLGIVGGRRLTSLLPLLVGIIGVVIGAVLAGATVVAAFMDQPFLRKLKVIGREPVRYLRPFLFTAVLGIATALFVLPLTVLSGGSRLPRTVLAGFTGFFGVYTIASVLPALDMLVQFVGLKFEASDIPDESVEPSRLKPVPGVEVNREAE